MSWRLFAVGALVVAAVFAWRALRNQFGHDEVDAQVKRWLRDAWPLLLLPLLIFGAEIETSQILAVMSLTLLAWAVDISWRFVRRDRRLGSVLVKVPSSRYAAVGHGTLAALFLLLAGLEIHEWRAYGREFPRFAGSLIALAVQNLLVARAGLEIRTGGVCNALQEWRWQEVRRWSWRPISRRPVLALDVGLWSPAWLAVPEARREDVEAALARVAQVRASGGSAKAFA